jgi:hypothetical protein
MQFPYHRSIAPMLWVFVALASIELIVAHMMLSFWKPWVAMVASTLSLVTMAWVVRLVLSFKTLPVEADDTRLMMRVGAFRSVSVTLDNIEKIRSSWPPEDLRNRAVWNLAMIAYPNVIVDLIHPVEVTDLRGRRTISAIAHRLDDPRAFLAWMGDRHVASM